MEAIALQISSSSDEDEIIQEIHETKIHMADHYSKIHSKTKTKICMYIRKKKNEKRKRKNEKNEK